MDDDTFFRSLHGANPEDENALDLLGDAAREDGRESTRAAVSLWRDYGLELPEMAGTLLQRLGELAIIPLSEVSQSLYEHKEVWRFHALVAGELSQRQRIIARLAATLADRRPVPVNENPDMEEAPIPRRLCDEAYLLLRRLLHLEESIEQHYMNERAFLQLEDAQKDEEILTAKRTRQWRDFTESEGG